MANGYDVQKWRDRMLHRSDMTGHLTHLTRGTGTVSSCENLMKILKDRKLNGSNSSESFITGDNPAVCFQEAPLYGISQNSFHEERNQRDLKWKVRYEPVGLSFPKKYVFEKGGRPVFYENREVAKSLLPKNEWYRIVNFNLSNDNAIIDWTHEREWRVKGDFDFDLSEAYVLLLNQDYYRWFIKNADKEIIETVKGIVVLQPVLE